MHDLVTQEEAPMWVVALDWSGIAIVILVIALALVQTIRHGKYQKNTLLQRSYVVILWLPPFCALFAWASLFLPKGERFFEVGDVGFDAIAIVMFYAIMIDYSGGSYEYVKSLAARKAPLTAFPSCYGAGWAEMGSYGQLVGIWRTCVYQVMSLPLWALSYAILVEADHHDKFYINLAVHLAMLIHVSICMLALAGMYYCSKEFELKGLNVVLKFFAIKLIVWLHIATKIIYAWCFKDEVVTDKMWGYTSKERGVRYLAYASLIQMVGFGLLFSCIFSVDDPALNKPHPVNELAKDEVEKEELLSTGEEDAMKKEAM